MGRVSFRDVPRFLPGVAAVATIFAVGFLAPSSDSRVLRGTNHGDALYGTSRADLIKGRGGNDRLYGRGGNDKLIGGPGKDRLAGGAGKDRLLCGPGRDTAIVQGKDVVKGCEIVKDSSGKMIVPVGEQGGGGVPPSPGPTPAPPPTDWIPVLTGHGAWYEPVPPTSANLWFFTNDGAAGYRRGSRAFCPNNNCGLSPYPVSFVWTVQGNVLHIQNYGSISFSQYQIAGYNAGTDTLSLIYNGSGLSFYGCRNPIYPSILQVPGTCP